MKARNLLLLLLLASLWGPSFLFIKVAVTTINPISLAALRIGIAAILLVVFLYLKGGRLTASAKFWKDVTIAGFFAHALPFVLINWGEIYIASGLASILNGLTPLFTILVAHFMIEDDKMNAAKVTGTLLGFAGLFLLISPSLSLNMQASILVIVAVSIGALRYGIAMVYARKNLSHAPPLHAPTAQLLVATVYLVPLSLIVDGYSAYNLLALPWEVTGSVLALAIFGTAIAFVVYYKIIEVANASYLALVTYLMPIYGVALGILFLNESLSWYAIAGAGLILTGLMIANKTISLKVLRPSKGIKLSTETDKTC
ncbi:DMT family transporter [Fulvivirga sp. RKSG066]|uniref:DMT family transporter n=1 Tax=Fulvivirga aurantia TaxID=2529383 RepID=UPI0012BD772C|nr:DMT family transporter [Fulvivirga aurantia]MTI23101.1 DMT family transporter [Fulvivirga aurantia]